MSEYSRIVSLTQALLRMPFFDSLPGGVLERIVAHVYDGEHTGTYDFADVVSKKRRTGWQVKSTRVATPVTWIRAKLPGKAALIRASNASAKGAQQLGDAIIDYCNNHAEQSFKKYDIDRLLYARLVDFQDDDGRLMYFERELYLPLFEKRDFVWHWSKEKAAVKKEQLSAFHGIDRKTERPWFAWHGLSENQLHFKGERAWWPKAGASERIDFKRSGAGLDLVQLAELIAKCGA